MTAWLAAALLLFVCAMVHATILERWRRQVDERSQEPEGEEAVVPHVFVTMIVPARNAATTLAVLLQDLHAQRYPKERCEVVVVDDHSEDGTADLVMSMARNWPQLRLIRPTDGEGKKHAITKGVEAAKGDLILLTDADAHCGPGRVEALARHWLVQRSDLVLMPVHTTGGDGVVSWLQREEQLALQGATAGSALSGTPLLANGANLAFTRKGFLEVGGFQGDRWASGDDMLLLKRMTREHKKLSYLLHQDTVVTVTPETDSAGFVAQRLRWAGKMRAYRGTSGFAGGLFATLFPWAMIALTVLVVREVRIGQEFLYTWSLLAGAWLLWLFPILRLSRSMARFFNAAHERTKRDGSLVSVLLSLVAFMIYAPIIAILSLALRPRWKGRRI